MKKRERKGGREGERERGKAERESDRSRRSIYVAVKLTPEI